jgi:hypothetical protein
LDWRRAFQGREFRGYRWYFAGSGRAGGFDWGNGCAIGSDPPAQNFPAISVKTLENAVHHIKNACSSGKNIVFSPAFSSFDQFSDYEERGKFFEKCIFSL